MKNFEKIIKESTKKTGYKIDTKKIKNVEVAFLDFDGKLREIVIPKVKLEKILNGGLMCDGSSIGENKVSNSDMNIIVDKDCIYALPNGNIMIIAHTDFSRDARRKLIEIEKGKLASNLVVNIGVELEFFMKNKDSSFESFDNLGYFEIDDTSTFNCLNDLMSFCEKINFPIESFHHECGHSQFEVNFKYDCPHRTADNLVFLKKIIRYFASKYNLEVSFLPKPFENECGSGMHTNISVSQFGTNLFYEKTDPLHLSNFAYKFADGIINHIEAITYISNPCENSYERLKFGSETPKDIEVCGSNRTSLIRVPEANEKSCRIEFRLPDVKSNPYLLFCAVLLSGFNETKSNLKSNNKRHIPKTLLEAKEFLIKDDLLKNLIPEKLLNN